jgi:sRNA-binding protein
MDAVYSVENKLGKETEALAVVNILYGKVRVKLDTGAEVNVIPFRVYQQLVHGR